MIKWPNDNFMMAATPWGNREALKEASQAYSDFMTASMADREATSPFARLPTLSPLANTLRAATIFANESAYKKNNRDTYVSACEILALAFENSEMAWVQIGQPNLLIIRNNQLTPLDVAVDLGIDHQMVSPLPGRLMGLDPQIDLSVKSIVLQPEDRLILLARSTIPPHFFTQDFSKKNSQEILNTLFEVAIDADKKFPFWLALLEMKL
jgi:hypothetical protein